MTTTAVDNIHGLSVSFDKKPSIPKITKKRVEELYKRIRPVVRDEDDDLSYMKPCKAFGESFIWDRHTSMTKKAAGLKAIRTIPTLHVWAYYGMFKPTIDEVMAQIPEDIIDEVVAFETIGPDDADDLNKQKFAVDAGFHLAKTILYSNPKKLEAKRPAKMQEEEKPDPSIKSYKYKRETDPKFLETFYVIEANSHEHTSLWSRYAHNGGMTDTHWGRISLNWEQVYEGFWFQVGEVAKMPVCVSVQWARIEGKLVMFWDTTSMVTHYDMAKNWVMWQCKNAKGHDNATNFGGLLHYLREATGKKYEFVK